MDERKKGVKMRKIEKKSAKLMLEMSKEKKQRNSKRKRRHE